MKTLLITLALARLGDAVTTGIALHQGGRELNPLLANRPAANLALQGAAVSAQLASLTALQRQHPRLARVLAFVAIATEGVAAANNVRVLRLQGRR